MNTVQRKGTYILTLIFVGIIDLESKSKPHMKVQTRFCLLNVCLTASHFLYIYINIIYELMYVHIYKNVHANVQ